MICKVSKGTKDDVHRAVMSAKVCLRDYVRKRKWIIRLNFQKIPNAGDLHVLT